MQLAYISDEAVFQEQLVCRRILQDTAETEFYGPV